ncbi:MAG TPA: bifunctional diaminohydroxyphosphoribosylaminopyrimidine deaminase/5-amino-6-(5-phosphoribosylamino)uracil reductase RibD [Burkholderiales bacterium]|nr:bifunctional diaminohydroxyphosphoribosylaminopyrimidine deaminase/5-amino-6-(5-phosphoribosylamino)uracil reductase RibD [Burkholderiales bacterium]
MTKSADEASHQSYMARALELARRGLYTTTPNPRVGCVIVRDHAVVGEGWHERAGEPHAEVLALRAAGELARGATAYVTLEPCAHRGRTPPCCEALAAAGVASVIAAMEDPNPLVAGKGFALLRAAHIAVASGLMAHEAGELNIGFVSRMTRKRPWVRLKVAASLDGKTALLNGRSQWITGPESRRDGHAWRAQACAVLTGIGTVKDDNPQLTVRDVVTTRQPLRVVVDSRLETPVDAKVVGEGMVIAAAANHADRADYERRAQALQARGAEIVVLPNASGKVELPDLMLELGRRGINELHVEAGYKLNGSLMNEGLVDELLLYLAPGLLGDAAHGMFHLPELKTLSAQRRLNIMDVRQIGPDIRILARVTPV